MSISPQLPLSIVPRVGERFESFFSGENQLLLKLARTVAERGSERQLGIWGAHGAGKSHVLNAVCHAAGACGRTATYLPLATLIRQSPSLLWGMEQVKVIVVDDLDVLCEQASWQRALFDLINRVRQADTSLVTASCKNPTALDLLPDLVSRLVWGPVLHLRMPSDSQLAEAVRERAISLGLEISTEVVNYLLSRYSRELGRLFAILAVLDRASLVEQRRLTVPFVRTVLTEGNVHNSSAYQHASQNR